MVENSLTQIRTELVNAPPFFGSSVYLYPFRPWKAVNFAWT